VLSSKGPPKPFADQRGGSYPVGKGRAHMHRRDQGGLNDQGASGSVTPHASPAGQPLAPEIGPGEPRGPADVQPGGRWR
jgi:hypothetical protein